MEEALHVLWFIDAVGRMLYRLYLWGVFWCTSEQRRLHSNGLGLVWPVWNQACEYKHSSGCSRAIVIYVRVCVCVYVCLCMYVRRYVSTVYVPVTGFLHRLGWAFWSSGMLIDPDTFSKRRDMLILLHNLTFQYACIWCFVSLVVNLLGLRHYTWDRKLWSENAVLANVTSRTLVENIQLAGGTYYFHLQYRNSRKDNERSSLPFCIRRVWGLRTLCRRNSPLRNPMWEPPVSCTKIPSHTPGHGLRADVHVEGI